MITDRNLHQTFKKFFGKDYHKNQLLQCCNATVDLIGLKKTTNSYQMCINHYGQVVEFLRLWTGDKK
jgi:hypothetical protein